MDYISNIKLKKEHLLIVIAFSLFFTLIYNYTSIVSVNDTKPYDINDKEQYKNHKIKNRIKNERSTQQLEREKHIYQMELQKLKSQYSIKTNINQYFKLFHLYYNGVPDKYDLNGNKIKGIEPNPGKAIWYLQRCIDMGFNRGIILMGDIYQHGMYNMNSDWKTAKIIYEKALRTDQWLDAMDKLEQISDKQERRNVYNWLNLSEPDNNENTHATYHKKLLKKTKTKSTPWTPMPTNVTINTNNLFRAEDINNAIAQNFRDNNTNHNTQLETDVDALTFNDAHNSHNSQVISTVKKSLENLRDKTDIVMTIPESMRNIRDYFDNQKRCDRQQDALKSLDSIERNTSPLTFSDMKEADALSLVWNRIHDDVNEKNIESLKENLLYELAEMQEHGKAVCATGRFTRIVDTLNAVDPEVTIKPTYIINEEMMTKSADIRSKMMEKMTENDKNRFERGNHSQQDELDDKLKNEIKNTLYEEYVKSDIMTESKFEAEINKWIDEI
jgi:hypothetical protein